MRTICLLTKPKSDAQTDAVPFIRDDLDINAIAGWFGAGAPRDDAPPWRVRD